jgi:hypothetical protein
VADDQLTPLSLKQIEAKDNALSRLLRAQKSK